MTRPDNIHDALREIQKILSAAMREVDGMRHEIRDEAVHDKLTIINSAMADAHLLTTWTKDNFKEMHK